MEHSKEVLEWARRKWAEADDLEKKNWEVVFPELKESEDERIRKTLVRHFSTSGGFIHDVRYEDIRAWLEKQKEQKPSQSIYWHAIKKGDTLPCRAYLWTPEYEKYYYCFEGRLIPNVENVTAGADMWYLPVKDIQALPREGFDELPKEHKPEAFKIPATPSVGMPKTPPSFKLNVKPAEWSEEDEQCLDVAIEILENLGYDGEADNLKHLRPQPRWKPSKEQMEALKDAFRKDGGNEYHKVINSLYRDLQKLL